MKSASVLSLLLHLNVNINHNHQKLWDKFLQEQILPVVKNKVLARKDFRLLRPFNVSKKRK